MQIDNIRLDRVRRGQVRGLKTQLQGFGIAIPALDETERGLTDRMKRDTLAAIREILDSDNTEAVKLNLLKWNKCVLEG